MDYTLNNSPPLPVVVVSATTLDLQGVAPMPVVLVDPTTDTLVQSAANYSCIVSATGGGTHTTLEAAIAAAPAGGRIFVASDLTIAPAAGATQYVVNKSLRIEFASGPGVPLRKVINNGDGDVWGTGLDAVTVGQINGVYIGDHRITRVSAGKSAGNGINLRGAFEWGFGRVSIEQHTVGVLFDAAPYPTGFCTHNHFADLAVNNCVTGLKFTNGPNANSFGRLHITNCTKQIDYVSGLNNRAAITTLENLSSTADYSTGTLVDIKSNGLQLCGLHCEGQGGNPCFALGASTSGTVLDGDIYVTTGVKFTIDATARYSIRQLGEVVAEHGANRGQFATHAKLIDTTVTDTYCVFWAAHASRIKEISIVPDGNVSSSSGANIWTLSLNDYNGAVAGAQIGSNYVQSGSIGMGKTSLFSGDYALAQDHNIRLTLTKTGSPGTFWRPLVVVEYDNDIR